MNARSWIYGVSVIAMACHTQATQPPPPSVVRPPVDPRASQPQAQPEPPGPTPQLGTFGVDLSTRKLGVEPGNDFYTYANGSWLDSYQLKPDEMRFGSMVGLQYHTEEQIKAILEELRQTDQAAGSEAQKLRDYYASFLDVAAANDKGITPLQPELDRIAAIEGRDQLVEALGRAALDNTNAPIALQVEVDLKNPDRHLLYIGHSGLGLPDRDYYLEDQFEQLRAAYLDNIAKLLGFTGLSAAQAAQGAADVLKLETEIATHHKPRTELRDVVKIYNLYSMKKLRADFRGYAWDQHLQAAGIDPAAIEEVVVTTPDALSPLAKLVKNHSLSSWKLYLQYHLLANHAPLLGDAIDDANFEFQGKVLSGQPEQRQRWKRAVSLVSDPVMRAGTGLPDALGKIYVKRHFPPAAKAQMDALVAHLRVALRERIEGLSWMSDSTKREALAKLETFNPKIGYPKTWRDLSSIEISPDDLVGNVRAVRKYWYDDNILRLGKPTDRDEWQMAVYAINAYYNPVFNEVVFPAGILQPPFFDPLADPAVNYGGIGGVIGHEMGHGFDDQGSKADAHGVQRNWWTDDDRAAFEQRAARLVAQYGQYEPLPGQKLNGELTQGENIGDLGGLTMAYDAYQLSLAGKPARVIDGYTGDQRFFLSWAQVWRSKEREQFTVMVLKSDPHSPGRFRVNGVVRNMDAWYAAFDVKPGDALYLEPADRVQIW